MNPQDPTTNLLATDKKLENSKVLTYEQQRVADWHAANGMRYWDLNDMGVVKRPSAKTLAVELGLSRQTIYDWPRIIPNFREHILEAQFRMIQTNIIAVWNAVFIKAADGDTKAAEMYLANFDPTFKLPSRQSKVEIQASGWGDIIAKARREMSRQRGD
jgi:hypothetical protein